MAHSPTLLSEQQFATEIGGMGLQDSLHDYHTLSGIVLSIASAPDTIPLSEWRDLVFTTEEPPAVPGKAAVETLYGHLVAQWQHWVELLADDSDRLPLPDEYTLANDRPTDAFSRFCKGLMIGHAWLEADWTAVLEVLEADGEEGREMREFFNGVLIATMLIADPATTRAVLAEDPDGTEELLDDNHELANATDFLPHGLKFVGSLGMTISQDLLTHQAESGLAPSVGRNDPCPCGSGKKYKKCCLPS